MENQKSPDQNIVEDFIDEDENKPKIDDSQDELTGSSGIRRTNEKIASLTDMGYSYYQVVAALADADGNLELAADYLISGKCDNTEEDNRKLIEQSMTNFPDTMRCSKCSNFIQGNSILFFPCGHSFCSNCTITNICHNCGSNIQESVENYSINSVSSALRRKDVITKDSDEMLCSICYESFNSNTKQPYALKCGHTLCKECYDGLIASPPAQRKCPVCRTSVTGGVLNHDFLKIVQHYCQ